MADEAHGRVSYANGLPAPGVRVRILDSDQGGADDDLTLAEGLSDAEGRFRVTYDRARAADRLQIAVGLGPLTIRKEIADPLDLYLPYLQLRYTLRGAERTLSVGLEGSPQEIRLPDPPPVTTRFIPSQHGFHFLNSFPGSPLPFTIPSLGGALSIPSIYGLCGGMSAAAADFLYAGRTVPATRAVPSKRTNLHAYLLRRQIDSFSPLGEPVLRFMKWMRMEERTPLGTWHRSFIEFEQLIAQFDAGTPAQPIGLVFANPGEPLWENHQVLACGYTRRSAARCDIQIYDPNYPENDQVFVRTERVSFSGVDSEGREASATTLRCERVAVVADSIGRPVEQVRKMRGMFLMPYAPVMPPESL